MIALLSALLGFVSSAVPEFFSLFREAKDRAHEITLLSMQMEQEKTRFEMQKQLRASEMAQQLEVVGMQHDAKESLALNARVKDSLIGIEWVDALSGSVRPILTYAFCLMYAAIKIAQYHVLLTPDLPWQTPMSAAAAFALLWSEDDMALFTAIIAFWFGQRMFGKAKKGVL